MFDAIRQPLTGDENMRQRSRDGKSLRAVAEEIIKPNDRLTSFERLEIYNRQYWFRILSALSEDFPGLRAIIGETALRQDGGRVSVRLPVAFVHAAQPGLAPGVVAAPASRAHRGKRSRSRSTWCAWSGRRSKLSTKLPGPV